jgi:hypothetical protein
MGSLTTHNYRTIKDAQSELRDWGRFWKRYTNESGGSLMFAFMQSQKSSTKYHKRKTYSAGDDRSNRLQGVDYPVDARCSETRSTKPDGEKEIFVPWHLQSLDDFIESLDPKLKNPLKEHYINDMPRNKTETYWLDRAENAVMLRVNRF